MHILLFYLKIFIIVINTVSFQKKCLIFSIKGAIAVKAHGAVTL